jgi:pilus assembly protein Flp/PilA
MRGTWRRFLRDTRGANMVEYILLVGVVALISIAAFKAFQGKIWDRTQKQGETVDHINSTPGSQ